MFRHNITLHLFLGLLSSQFSGGFSTRILYELFVSLVLVTCPAYCSLLIFTSLVLDY